MKLNQNIHFLDLRIRADLEQLMKSSPPSREKCFQLIKTLQSEGAKGSEYELQRKVHNFYKVEFERRTAGYFKRIFEIRPYPWLLNQFVLDYSNITVSQTTLLKIASNFRHAIRNVMSAPDLIVDTGFLHVVLHRLTHPRYDQKSTAYNFYDFVDRWQTCTRSKWGDQFDQFFKDIYEAIPEDLKTNEPTAAAVGMATFENDKANEPDLTQTELDWMKTVIMAIHRGELPPQFPLSKPPKNPGPRTLNKITRLMRIYKRKGNSALFDYESVLYTARDICHKHLVAYNQLPEELKVA